MNGMFDVDCPRTPGEDNGGTTNKQKRSSTTTTATMRRRNNYNDDEEVVGEHGIEVSIPTVTTSTTARNATPRSSSSSSKSLFSPRPSSRNIKKGSQRARRQLTTTTTTTPTFKKKSDSKKKNKGLEPEEYIISSSSSNDNNNKRGMLQPPSYTATEATSKYHINNSSDGRRKGGTSSSNELQQGATKNNSSDGASVNMTQLNLTQSSSTANNNVHYSTTTTNNPFDGDTLDGGQQGVNGGGGGGRGVSKKGDGVVAMEDKYYGIDSNTKHELYGPSSLSHTAVDVEQGHSLNDEQTSKMTPWNLANHVDDYSFSNVNLSSSPGGGSGRQQEQSSSSQPSSFINNVLQVFTSTTDKSNRYGPTNAHFEDEFATGGSSSSHHPRKEKGTIAFLSRLSSTQQIGFGLLWMVVLTTIFGVTISELKKSNNNSSTMPNGNGGGASHVLGGEGGNIQMAPPVRENLPTYNPTPWPEDTPSPTDGPTDVPTTVPPSISPVTSSPIGGYYNIHGKAYDGTVHPTRHPTTVAPSNSPTTASPTTYMPSTSPTVNVLAVQAAASAQSYCSTPEPTTEPYLNHNGVLKTCTWLHNDKDGETDRKDKNCGGRTVVDTVNGGLITYETTELGNVCKQTCRDYNGCAEEEDGMTDAGGSGMSNMATMNSVISTSTTTICTDDTTKLHLNHLKNLKSCEWLHNDKDGKTDRKDKNCGVDNVKTNLGKACMLTCSLAGYNVDCIQAGSIGGSVTTNNKGGEVQVMRSYLSSSYSFSVSNNNEEEEKVEPEKNDESTTNNVNCTNGNGMYHDHTVVNLHTCDWLSSSNISEEQLHKNCGVGKHEMTELGKECPLSCKEYNDCV